MWPSVVVCITMGYLFHVWGGVGVGLFISRRALAREGDYEMMRVCACVCACVS